MCFLPGDPSLPERKTNEHIDISTPFMGVNAEGVKDLNGGDPSLQEKKANKHIEVSTLFGM
uniref:Uncharacterized protein n=1 Tax=Solanum tuberosum TaxID=4113 RepID=M1DJ18_SOLTU